MNDVHSDVAQITPRNVNERFQKGERLVVLDVREPDERAICIIPTPEGVHELHIPMAQIPIRLDEIREASLTGPLLVYCHLGQRLLDGRSLARRPRHRERDEP